MAFVLIETFQNEWPQYVLVMAIRVVEFSSRGYKIRKIFA